MTLRILTAMRPAAIRSISPRVALSSNAMSYRRFYASKGTEGAQPKILNESPPREGEESEDVAAHNKEMDERADRATVSVSDQDIEKDKERQKVDKEFWKGHAGEDKKS